MSVEHFFLYSKMNSHFGLLVINAHLLMDATQRTVAGFVASAASIEIIAVTSINNGHWEM